jgi:hypothetical protein
MSKMNWNSFRNRRRSYSSLREEKALFSVLDQYVGEPAANHNRLELIRNRHRVLKKKTPP